MCVEQLSSNTEKMASLQETLARKDEEMRAMEERYTRYLDKAKSVSWTVWFRMGETFQPHGGSPLFENS